jgi:hypothetical protein
MSFSCTLWFPVLARLASGDSAARGDASPKSLRPTNSTIFVFNTASGSTSRVSDPLRKLCRRLAGGHAPSALSAGGQFRSM